MGRRRLTWPALVAGLALLLPATATAQDVEPRVVGGSETSIADYPWQAAVVESQDQAPGQQDAHQRQFCGGSLVTSRIVITAAHCLTGPGADPDCFSNITCSINDPGGDGTVKIDPNDVSVVLGRTTLTDTAEGEEITTQATAFRANFDDGTLENDVGYLVLSAPSAQERIMIAGADEGALWDPGSPVDVSGWGSTSEGGSTVDALRAATVEVISDATCGSGSVYGSDFKSASMVCAGFLSGGVDTCQGDSGGPLEAGLEGGGSRLVGITSWGDGCAQANAPGVYSRVAGSTLRPLVESDVATLEESNGLTHEEIIGAGGQPKSGNGAPPPPPVPVAGSEPTSTVTAAATNPFAKCKRIRNRTKRKRCVKKVRARLNAQT